MPHDQGNVDLSELAQFVCFAKQTLFSFPKHPLPLFASHPRIVDINIVSIHVQ
jgi:hypothetical protein